MEENSPQGIWDHIAEKMLVELAESACPIFRATSPCPEVSSRAKDTEKLSIHYCADQATIEIFFSHNCFCKSAQSLRSSRKHVWRVWKPFTIDHGNLICWWDNQLFLSEIKTEVPLEWWPSTSKPSIAAIWRAILKVFHRLTEWVNFAMDAGFISVVEIGQYFMTKDNGETTLCKFLSWIHSSKMWWIITTKKMDSGKHKNWTRIGNNDQWSVRQNMELKIRIWSLSEDNTQSWVRISHGSNKFVIDSNNNDTEIPEDLPEEQALQLKVKDFCMPIKGKSKTAKKRTCWIIHRASFQWEKESGLILEQGITVSQRTRFRRT